MATQAKPANGRKKFRVMVSGPTVDGRTVTREQIQQMAASYNPSVYGARVNLEHYLSPLPDSSFCAMGDVTALSAEDIQDGPLKGQTALYAEIEPTKRMKDMTDDGKKIYSSVEMHPKLPLTNGAYLLGLAMTDTPASLGTDRLKFAAEKRGEILRFSAADSEPTMFTLAIEAELYQEDQQREDSGKEWFSKVMGILGKGKKTDDERFSQIHQAVEVVAQSQADSSEHFSALQQELTATRSELDTLKNNFTALRGQLEKTDNDFSKRPPATGGANAQLADY